MSEEKELYIKTRNGVCKIAETINGDKYFECNIDGVTFTVFEGSQYWKDNEKGISEDIVSLGDVLVMVQPKYIPQCMDIKLLYDKEWVDSFIRNIKKEGYHYYLSSWDEKNNLKKFAELTTKGIMFL